MSLLKLTRLASFLAIPLLCLTVPQTRGVDAPRPWPPDQWVPVTEERIAKLPLTEQGAWRAYWNESVARLKVLGPLDFVDHSLQTPSEGPAIPSTYSQGVRLREAAAWYASEDARVIADHVANWQTLTGGWVKTGDYKRDRVPADNKKDSWSAGTFDNDSTIYELRYLALVYTAAGADTPRARVWRDSFMKGLDYVLAAQFPNGGFPQIYPLVGAYHDAITFNDDAMVHIIDLLRDINGRKAEFAFVPETLASEAGRRVERAIQCILAAQLRGSNGQRTVWGQQHDALTMLPCAARNFEPMSECSSESAHLVQFLMAIPNPSPAIISAVDDAMKWFPKVAFHNVAPNREDNKGSGLVARDGAPDLWARFYEIGTGKALFGDRDRTIHYQFGELSNERRRGYSWFQTAPNATIAAYKTWRAKLDATPAK